MRVLIVEDEPNLARQLRSPLERILVFDAPGDPPPNSVSLDELMAAPPTVVWSERWAAGWQALTRDDVATVGPVDHVR